MPSQDQRAYAKSEKGKAARLRARRKYIEKRRAERTVKLSGTSSLAELIRTWGRP